MSVIVRNGNVEVLPATIQQITFEYLRLPADPVWGYTTSNNRETYSAASSTDFEVPVYAFTDIVSRLVAVVEESIDSHQSAQYAIANENKST